MTRSIFDPDGGETEQSGSTFLGPRADNISHMPPDITDGEAAADADADTVEDLSARADELPTTPNTDSAEIARRLAQMTSEAPSAGEPQDEMPPPAGA